MVQEFNVVRCFSCCTFQVEQVKKSTNKWTCKICNEKQTRKQIFFRGTGKECRIHCQQKNMDAQKKSFERDENKLKNSSLQRCANDTEAIHIDENDSKVFNGESKWSSFMDNRDSNDNEVQDESSIEFRGEFDTKTSKLSQRKRKGHTKDHCDNNTPLNKDFKLTASYIEQGSCWSTTESQNKNFSLKTKKMRECKYMEDEIDKKLTPIYKKEKNTLSFVEQDSRLSERQSETFSYGIKETEDTKDLAGEFNIKGKSTTSEQVSHLPIITKKKIEVPAGNTQLSSKWSHFLEPTCSESDPE